MKLKLHAILFFFILLLFLSLSESLKAQKDQSVGRVLEVIGTAHISSIETSPIIRGKEINISDTLTTSSDGFIELAFLKHSRIYLKSGSQLVFHRSEHLEMQHIRPKLLSGEMLIETVESPFPIQVTTPTAIASASHAKYSIIIERNGSTTFTGIDGTAEITAASSGESQMLSRRSKLSTDMRGQYFTIQHISNREINGVMNMYNRSSNGIPKIKQ